MRRGSDIGGYMQMGRSLGTTKGIRDNMDMFRKKGRMASTQSLLKFGMQVVGLFIGGVGGAAATAASSILKGMPTGRTPDYQSFAPPMAPPSLTSNYATDGFGTG